MGSFGKRAPVVWIFASKGLRIIAQGKGSAALRLGRQRKPDFTPVGAAQAIPCCLSVLRFNPKYSFYVTLSGYYN